MIDRRVFGIQHLYKRPVYARTKVLVQIMMHFIWLSLPDFSSIAFPGFQLFYSQECSINSPNYGPLPPDAPSWCQAPFDPEGLLRFVLISLNYLVKRNSNCSNILVNNLILLLIPLHSALETHSSSPSKTMSSKQAGYGYALQRAVKQLSLRKLCQIDFNIKNLIILERAISQKIYNTRGSRISIP